MASAQVVSARKPTDAELRALGFAWKIVKHVKSNAVVFARADRTLAIGGGQTSRVDAVHVASAKAARVGNVLAGSVLASDAFFPFPDGLETAIAAGATACVQPGGSARDADVIAAADRLGARQRDHRVGVARLHRRESVRDAAHAVAAGRGEDPLDPRTRRDLPGERVLAAATAEDQHPHGVSS